MEKLWLKSYADGVPQTIDLEQIGITQALSRHGGTIPRQ